MNAVQQHNQTSWYASLSSHGLMVRGLTAILIACSFMLSNAVHAQTVATAEPQYDVYQLSAEAETDVVNDLMSVNLVAQASGNDSAELANKVNATMGWAVAKLKPFTAIDVRTLDYQTYPQYERKGSQIKGWIASQTIRLETDDFEQAGKAIKTLQQRMLVQGMRHKPKPETRERAEVQLINTALEAFKRRSKLVQTNMGAKGFRVMNLSINTNRAQPEFRGRATTSAISEVATPVIQAGTSNVTVHINGQIQLE